MMSEKKTDQALRLMEALDGVDPELLARSERKKKIIPFQYYARIAAACLALLVAGVMFAMARGGVKLKNESASDTGNGFSGAGKSINAITQDQSANDVNTDYFAAEGIMAQEADAWGKEAARNACESMTAEIEEETAYRDDMSDAQQQGNTASLNGKKEEDAISVNEQKKSALSYEMSLFLERFLTGRGLRNKDDTETAATQAAGKLAVTMENETVICDAEALSEICEYLGTLELAEAVTDDGTAEPKKEVALSSVDEAGQVTGWITIGRNYLRFDGEEKVYQILNDDYDFDALYEKVKRIVREEKE